MVFEAARRGICPVVTRRLHDSEKTSLVVSGSVFAFDEHATGIKRWTDGTLWSPSRIIGNYLVYRELEKKGNKTARGVEAAIEPTSATLEGGGPAAGCAAGASEPTSPVYAQNDPFDQRPGTAASQSQAADLVSSASSIAMPSGATGLQRDVERALIGSLTTSYKFKKGGLVKKTISNGSLHLICYYSIEDVVAGRLRAPSSLMELASLEISPSLLDRKNFRLPPLLELDSNGELRYVGEEADPASNPGTIGPMVSPTVSSRPLDTPHHSSDSQALGAMFEAATVLNPAEYYDEIDSQAMSSGHPSAQYYNQYEPELPSSAQMPSFQPGPPYFAAGMPQEDQGPSWSEQREAPAVLDTYPASMPQTSFLHGRPPPFQHSSTGTYPEPYPCQAFEQQQGRSTPHFPYPAPGIRPLSSSAVGSSIHARTQDPVYGSTGAPLAGSMPASIAQQRSLIARTAPQARSVYNSRPYDRRPSEPGALAVRQSARPTSSPVVYNPPHPFKLATVPGEPGSARQTQLQRPSVAMQPLQQEPARSHITSPPPIPSHMPPSQHDHLGQGWQYPPGNAWSPHPQAVPAGSILQPHDSRYPEAAQQTYHNERQPAPQALQQLDYREQQDSPVQHDSTLSYSHQSMKAEDTIHPYHGAQPESEQEGRSPLGWQPQSKPDHLRARPSYHYRSETYPQGQPQAPYAPPSHISHAHAQPSPTTVVPHSAPAAGYGQYGGRILQHQQHEALRSYEAPVGQPQWTTGYSAYQQHEQQARQNQQHIQHPHQLAGPQAHAQDRHQMAPGQSMPE